ncbi:MAG: hypothetical protein FJZ63_05865, partial [Chlamydiae bacterium]|nr:hypothetical protein [Chlamydiota bacterium]
MSHKLSFYQESIQLPIATRLALLAEGVSKRSVVPISLIQGALKRLQAWRDNYPRLRKTTVGRNLSPVTFGLDAVESVQAKMVASGTKALPFYNRAKQSLEKLSHVPLSLERGEHINEATMHLQQCLYILQKEQGLQPPLDRLARFLKEPLKYKRFLLEADCYDFFSRQKGFQGIKFLLHETLSQMLALPKEDFEAGHVTSGKLFSIKNITRSMMLQEALLGASCSRTLDLCMFFAEEEDADAYAEVVEELRGLLQVKIELRKGLHLSIATQDFSSLNEI